MTKTPSMESLAVAILTDRTISSVERTVRLADLSARVTVAVAMPCPFCGKKGPHEDNGQTGRDLAYLCTDCGEQWDAQPL